MKKIVFLVGVCIVGMGQNIYAAIITGDVNGTQNLYHDGWLNPAFAGGNQPEYVNYNFISGQTIDFNAAGTVGINSTSFYTPDGDSSSIFRDNTVYSLIGVWSSSTAFINPIESFSNPAFFIGSSSSLIVPTYAGDISLFLGVNDGAFGDNLADPKWSYTINVSTNSVPAPAPIWLVGSGLIVLFGKRKKSVSLPKKHA